MLRTTGHPSRWLPAVTVLCWVPTAAFAQATTPDGGFNAHGFDLAPFDGDTRDPLVVVRPGRMHGGEWWVGGLGEYASEPLVQVVEASFTHERTRLPMLDQVYALNLSGGYAVHDYVRLEASLPVFVASEGPQGAQQWFDLGDLRAGGTIAILRPDHVEWGGGFGLAVSGHVDVPSGRTKHFLGRGKVAGGGRLSATYEYLAWTFTGNAGAQINPTVEVSNLTGADAMFLGFAAGWRPHRAFGLNAEIHASPPLGAGERPYTELPAEVLLSARVRTDKGAHFTLGAATAVSRGAGAARYRLFLGGGWGKITPFRGPDTDTEGMFAASDGCPAQVETVNGWQDDDGCPDGLGKMNVRVVHDGKEVPGVEVALIGPDGPITRTTAGGGVAIDAMPTTSWTASARHDVCLEGTGAATAVEGPSELVIELHPVLQSRVTFEVVSEDGTPVPNVNIQWQTEHPSCLPYTTVQLAEGGRGYMDIGEGAHRIFVTAEGFNLHEQVVTLKRAQGADIRVVLKPTKVRVEKKRIVILDKVHFEYNKAVIKTDSYELLNEVAATIMANPEVGRVEVAGHTDSDGPDKYNLDLSQRRSESVAAYLAERGVKAERLVAVGYGEKEPIATNRTQEGKARNRRVEFNLIDQEDEPTEGDGATVPEPETP